jgi:hypothetical protein
MISSVAEYEANRKESRFSYRILPWELFRLV